MDVVTNIICLPVDKFDVSIRFGWCIKLEILTGSWFFDLEIWNSVSETNGNKMWCSLLLARRRCGTWTRWSRRCHQNFRIQLNATLQMYKIWKLLKLAIAMTIVNWITAKKSKIQDATLWTQFNSPMQSIDWLLLPISWFKIQITNERTSSNSRGEHCLAKNCAMNATGFSGRFFKTSLTTWPEIQNKLHEAQKTKLKFTIYTSKLQLKNSLQMNWNAQYLPCNIHCHLLVLRRTCISFSSQ